MIPSSPACSKGACLWLCRRCVRLKSVPGKKNGSAAKQCAHGGARCHTLCVHRPCRCAARLPIYPPSRTQPPCTHSSPKPIPNTHAQSRSLRGEKKAARTDAAPGAAANGPQSGALVPNSPELKHRKVFVVELSRKPLFPGIYTPVLVVKNERLIKEVMEAKKHGCASLLEWRFSLQGRGVCVCESGCRSIIWLLCQLDCWRRQQVLF